MIYMDYNATTPVSAVVRNAMTPWLTEWFGNPSSSHAAGRRARAAVDHAREQTAELLGAKPEEIVFTSGGTESNNTVIRSIARTLAKRGKHIIISAVEHPAVVNPCRALQSEGFEISVVGVDALGRVDPQEIAGEVRADTILISVMHANNEVGTIQPIAEIAEVANVGGILMHTDAAQTCGKIDTHVDELGVDFLSVAGHKMYAPQGIGVLYIRGGLSIEPLLYGAAHERGRRAGTEAVPLIVGLGAATEQARRWLDGDMESSRGRGTGAAGIGSEPVLPPVALEGEPKNSRELEALRDRLWNGIRSRCGGDAVLLGDPVVRLPNTLSVGFSGRYGSDILLHCPELCASTGAACHSGKASGSSVLSAMKVPENVAAGAIRFSLGRESTAGQVDEVIAMIAAGFKQTAAASRKAVR